MLDESWIMVLFEKAFSIENYVTRRWIMLKTLLNTDYYENSFILGPLLNGLKDSSLYKTIHIKEMYQAILFCFSRHLEHLDLQVKLISF